MSSSTGTRYEALLDQIEPIFNLRSIFWYVFLHDRHENVLLHSFAIKTLSRLTITDVKERELEKLKRKILIVPQR